MSFDSSPVLPAGLSVGQEGTEECDPQSPAHPQSIPVCWDWDVGADHGVWWRGMSGRGRQHFSKPMLLQPSLSSL